MIIALVLLAIGLLAVVLAPLLALIGGPTVDLNSILGATFLIGGAIAMSVLAIVQRDEEPSRQ